MNDNPRAVMGGNNPPEESPIDAITAPYGDYITEAENWSDGQAVETEAQMHAVDDLRKKLRQWRLDLTKGQKDATAPLHDAWKAEGARWKPTLDDATRLEGCLVAAVDAFKRKLAAEKDEADRIARAKAAEAERIAREAARTAEASDINAQREAAALADAAKDARQEARIASNDTVKGMRTVTRHEITDYRALINWIAVNDKPAMAAFADEWARRNHKAKPQADGLRTWEEKEAY